jgi:hypothetical protein
MKLIATLLVLCACGGAVSAPDGVVPTAGHAPNDVPAWDLTTGACDNADFRRIEGDDLTGVAVVCGWSCVNYQGTQNSDLEITMIRRSPVAWAVAQEQGGNSGLHCN